MIRDCFESEKRLVTAIDVGEVRDRRDRSRDFGVSGCARSARAEQLQEVVRVADEIVKENHLAAQNVDRHAVIEFDFLKECDEALAGVSLVPEAGVDTVEKNDGRGCRDFAAAGEAVRVDIRSEREFCHKPAGQLGAKRADDLRFAAIDEREVAFGQIGDGLALVIVDDNADFDESLVVGLGGRLGNLREQARGEWEQREEAHLSSLYCVRVTLKTVVDVKTAIENGDAEGLRRLLNEQRSRANELIRWGTNNVCVTHPLHFVCDMLFQGTLPKDAGVPLVEALIDAGSDLNFQCVREDGKKSDTPLIGAASLGAEDVGIRLLDAGARPELRGLFGEMALHWAALLGQSRLAARLIEGSDLNLKDDRYQSPPLGWAIHGWTNPAAGNCGRQRDVVILLVSEGAVVGSELLDSARANPEILAALRTEGMS